MNCFEWPTDPALLFDAARDVRLYQLQWNGETLYFLIFMRRSGVVDEELCSIKGVMLALFETDCEGAVKDWNQRFEIEGRNLDSAFKHFAYRFVNGLISPFDVRLANAISEDERDRLDALLGANDTDFHPDFYRDDDSPS